MGLDFLRSTRVPCAHDLCLQQQFAFLGYQSSGFELQDFMTSFQISACMYDCQPINLVPEYLALLFRAFKSRNRIASIFGTESLHSFEG